MNIFDLLMGDMGNLAAGPVTGKSGSAEAADGLFDALINSYMASAGIGMGDGAAGFSLKTTSPTNPLGIDFPVVGDDIASKVSENWPGAVSENVAEFNRQLLSILPKQSGVIRANVADVLNLQSVQLEPGTYEILSSKIEDGNITLEVAGKGTPDTAIKITLPADAFTGPANAQMTGLPTSRVALGTEAYRLDNMLSQMNLKEVQVEASPRSGHSSEITQPVSITLIAETTAGEQLLRAKLERSRVRVSEAEVLRPADGHKGIMGRPLTASPVSGAAKVYTPLGVHNNSSVNTVVRTSAAIAEANGDPWSSFTSTDGRSGSGDSQQSLEILFGYEAKYHDEPSATVKSEAQNLRFTLPDDLGANLRVNGRAVTIKIEPEHLGPARLSLSMADDKLKARIVVESTPAKVALEQNLDRLVNELNKAGIDVEKIDITINNGGAHNEMLGRQPHWRHRVATRLPGLDLDSSDPTEIPIIPPPAASTGYAGPAGVNLLA